MVSRETRVIGAGVASAFVLLAVFAAVELTYGLSSGWVRVASFVAFAVVGVLLPQLYLAWTDESVPPAWRVRTGLLVVLLIGAAYSAEATTFEGIVIWGIVGASFLAVAAYEFRQGYLASTGPAD